MARATTELIIINGLVVPAPDEGYEIQNAIIVDAARNTNGVTVGQQIGPDDGIWKINNLQWSNLTPDEWIAIKTALKPFYVPVTFTNDMNERLDLIMYPGDKTSMPYHVENLSYKRFRNCKFNLIDTGKR